MVRYHYFDTNHPYVKGRRELVLLHQVSSFEIKIVESILNERL